ncbi:MAG: FtsH protease activity modulator HflK [Gammaproteobacteria bacterium]|nr:FtsH protease activity modulator HflK [Gammaproteobacteria bacterium]
MAWNEPGQGKDPWNNNGNRGRGGGQDGPPDLDEVVRNLQRKINGLFGGGSGGRGDSGNAGNNAFAGLIFFIALAIWLASGFYQVRDYERGVVLQFGDAKENVAMPGLHWHIPWPIESVEKVNVSEIAEYQYKTEMLTRDENIVTVAVSVQYRRADPISFLFNVREPEVTLEDVTDSAVREVVGKNTMDFVLGEGREEITSRTLELVQSTLESYGTGIEITTVNLQDANFPPPVQPAVRDAIKAREDKERLELEAQSYANDVVPRARGEAARRIQAAEAYREEQIANAEGESDRFLALLREYKKAPGVTRERLYLQTMEQVLGNTSKVLVSAEGSDSLMYLPLDQLMKQAGSRNRTEASTTNSSNEGQNVSSSDPRDRNNARARGDR